MLMRHVLISGTKAATTNRGGLERLGARRNRDAV